MKVEVDAWYVDLPAQTGCARPAAPVPVPPADPNGCTDRLDARVAGDVKLGFPIKTVTVTTIGEGDTLEMTTSAQEVTALEVTRLAGDLFDVPKDFVEANSTAEVVPALAAGGSLADALFGSTADGTSTAAPKKPGTDSDRHSRTDQQHRAGPASRPAFGKTWSASSTRPPTRRFPSPVVPSRRSSKMRRGCSATTCCSPTWSRRRRRSRAG